MKDISTENNNFLVELLNKCEPGNLSHDVFEAVARVAVYPAVEFIPLRKKDGHIEVLLFERPDNDLIWPSMMHTPGTILRPTDATIDNAFNRLYKDELMNLPTDPPVFIGAYLSINSRGRCLLLEYLLKVQAEPKCGVFYKVSELPKTFIPEQQASLDRAIAAFVKQ